MKNYLPFKILLLMLAVLLFTSGLTFADEHVDIDQECSDRLEGTMSVEKCLEGCTALGFKCGLAITYDADREEGLDEDLKCYACRKEICADYGRIDARAKVTCDADPNKKSVAAAPLPDGTPCWLCVDKKDKCSTKFPASTIQTTCLAGCPKPTHKCVQVGKVDKEKCYQCAAKVPPPPPPKTCRKLGLLVAGQCKTCKDPTPMCIPAGVVAVNGPCFHCVKKPKITCSEFGLQDKCKCGPDEVKKIHIKTKLTPQGIKLRKKCCECVKKPEQCIDINLYTKSECDKACKKPGKCVKTARSKKGDCYDCISPTTCEEKGFSTTCRACYDRDQLCRDITTDEGVKCKECYDGSCKDLGFEDDCSVCRNRGQGCRSVSPLNAPEDWICKECFGSKDMCEDAGLPGNCPGTCSDGEMCINVKDCHLCMKVKKIEVTWVIIIIETPYGRVVLDDNHFDQYNQIEPKSIMVLSTLDDQLPDIGEDAPDLNAIGDVFKDTQAASIGTTEEIAEKLKNKLLTEKRVFSERCFDDFEIATPKKNPPQSTSGGAESFGEDNEKNLVLNGPVIACGKIKGKSVLNIYSASGVPIRTVTKRQLEENPDIIVESLKKAAMDSMASLKLDSANSEIQEVGKPQFSDTLEGQVVPNDPYYHFTEKKSKKVLGVFGGKTVPKISFGANMRMGKGMLGKGAGAKVKKAESAINDQWGIKRVGYLPKSDPNSAWNVYEGNTRNVLVAVIDSGFDFTHPDAPRYTWTNLDEIPDNGIDDDGNGYIDDVKGWNFVDHNNDLTDFKGHGTFVAGIIAAKTNNGIGIAGINPGAVIMPLKVVADRKGETNSILIFQAIHYAVNKGAKIINISLGGRGISKLEQHAINYAYANGALVIVASGNNGNYLPDIGPASARRSLSVGSIDFDGTRSTITSWGPNNGLLGSGELIASLQSKDAYQEGGQDMGDPLYYRQSGSSFSTPMVAATASLLLAKNPNLTQLKLEDILMGTTVDMHTPGWDGQTGAGLLNATNALKAENQQFTTLKITELNKNWNKKKKFESVDVYVTVRGSVKEYVIEVGKGKRAKKFNQVAGPFTDQADHNWVTTIGKDNLRGSDDWIIRLRAISNGGQEQTAQTLFYIKDRK